jgi:hypothetical protein
MIQPRKANIQGECQQNESKRLQPQDENAQIDGKRQHRRGAGAVVS